ncbi:MAG TPA: hypothetical protein VF466_01475 [Candidatus Saccharimonadales bacterium]
MLTIGPIAEIHPVTDLASPNPIEAVADLAQVTSALIAESARPGEVLQANFTHFAGAGFLDSVTEIQPFFRATPIGEGTYDMFAQLPPTPDNDHSTLFYAARYTLDLTEARPAATIRAGELAIVSVATVSSGQFRKPQPVPEEALTAENVMNGLTVAVGALANRATTVSGNFSWGYAGIGVTMRPLPSWAERAS